MQDAATARVSEISTQLPEANVYGINEMHGTLIFYVLAHEPSVYGLTANQQNPRTGKYDWNGYWTLNPNGY
jgi:hypothetical protein